MKHALGNAMIPIVTVIGLQFGGMLGGSAVTEKVFNVNGIGSYIVDKQVCSDIPVVLAGCIRGDHQYRKLVCRYPVCILRSTYQI